MKNEMHLNIKTPCNENFNTFPSTLAGGFCNSCKKEVIDFTKMNSVEIINYFSKENNKNTCGRINSNQLETINENNNQRKHLNILSGIGLACLSLFSFSTAQAQDTKTTKDKTKTQVSTTQEAFVVKGNVTDNEGPLLGINVFLEGTSKSTTTDFDGNFEFPEKLNKGDVLIFSFIGLETKKITISNEHSTSSISLNVNMEMDNVVLMGKVAVKGVYKSKNKK